MANGYKEVYTKDTGKSRHVQTVIAEGILGRRLRRWKEEVHHVDQNKLNNEHNNLVICTHQLHRLIHVRLRALAAGGQRDDRMCRFCKEYDSLDNLVAAPISHQFFHTLCSNKYKREWSAKKKEKISEQSVQY